MKEVKGGQWETFFFLTFSPSVHLVSEGNDTWIFIRRNIWPLQALYSPASRFSLNCPCSGQGVFIQVHLSITPSFQPHISLGFFGGAAFWRVSILHNSAHHLYFFLGSGSDTLLTRENVTSVLVMNTLFFCPVLPPVWGTVPVSVRTVELGLAMFL